MEFQMQCKNPNCQFTPTFEQNRVDQLFCCTPCRMQYHNNDRKKAFATYKDILQQMSEKATKPDRHIASIKDEQDVRRAFVKNIYGEAELPKEDVLEKLLERLGKKDGQ